MKYEVFRYNIPKVEDNKAVPVPPHAEMMTFDNPDAAKKFAIEHKGAFDRVVVTELNEKETTKMVDRYIDGKHDMPPPKPAPAEGAAKT